MIEPARIPLTPSRPTRINRVNKIQLTSIEQRNSLNSRNSLISSQVRIRDVKQQNSVLDQNVHRRISTTPNSLNIRRHRKADSGTTSINSSFNQHPFTRSCNFEFKRLSWSNLGSFRKNKRNSPRIPSVHKNLEWTSDKRQNKISPNSFGELNKTTETRSKQRKQKWWRRCCFALCLCTLVALLLAALAGMIATLVLRSTTKPTIPTTTTTVTTSTSTTSTSSTSSTSTSSTSSTSSITSTSVTTTSTSTTSKTTSTTTSSRTTSTTSVTTSTLTTTTTTRALTTPACTDWGRGTIYQQFTASPSSWTKVTRTYTATYTNPVLYFAFETGAGDSHFLDDVSVVDAASPSVESLDNPSFDDTTFTNGWNQWCAPTCTANGNGGAAQLTTGFNCRPSPNRCLQAECVGIPGIFLISQSFQAIIGRTYTISFWHIHSGSSSANEFYVDVF